MNRKVLMPISVFLALFVLITLTAFPSNVVLAQSSQQPAIGSSISSIKGSSSTAAPSNLNSTKLLTRLEKIPSLSNIVGVSMINGIQVSGINVGDTDLSVTLRRQITTSTTTPSNTANNMSSLPVTVIAVKLPITNLTQLLSTVEATRSLAAATQNSANPMDAATGQIGSNAVVQSNAFQILSLLKNIQIGAGSIVNANWTLPQTISMGYLGLGNRIAASAPSDFVLVVVVPFQGESNIPTLRLG
jgi:hypothetical protein